MDEEKFDAMIVGGGLAGCIAAYELAKAGLEVVVVERGSFSGSKNMTGGRLYGHSLEQVIPGFAARAPIERLVTKERLSFLTKDGGTTMEYANTGLADVSCASYTVLRAPFDRWLAEQAEQEGAMFVNDIRVDDVILRDGKVCGVVAGEDEMEADVVLLADGAVSLLGQKLGMVPPLDPHKMAVGVKEVIELGEKTVSDRFGCADGEGTAWMFDGYCTDDHIGGGFLYTNRESISLGIVTTIGDIDRNGTSAPEMLERLKAHPVVAPLVEGGTLREYTGRMIVEGGLAGVPELVGNGVLVLGDAAALGINIGYCVRGMDLAIESGRLAAQAVLQAREKNDFSAHGLNSYKTLIDESFIMRDMRFYRRFPQFMENARGLFGAYPDMIDEIMSGMFRVDGSEPVKLSAKAMAAAKKVGLGTIAKDVRKGLKAL